MTYHFHSGYGADYIEADTLAKVKHHITGHAPCTTKHRAVSTGANKWVVLAFGATVQGPCIRGYLSAE